MDCMSLPRLQSLGIRYFHRCLSRYGKSDGVSTVLLQRCHCIGVILMLSLPRFSCFWCLFLKLGLVPGLLLQQEVRDIPGTAMLDEGLVGIGLYFATLFLR